MSGDGIIRVPLERFDELVVLLHAERRKVRLLEDALVDVLELVETELDVGHWQVVDEESGENEDGIVPRWRDYVGHAAAHELVDDVERRARRRRRDRDRRRRQRARGAFAR